MKRSTFLFLFLFGTISFVANGDEPVKEGAPAMAGYRLKNTSNPGAASLNPEVRTPFWPIGYSHIAVTDLGPPKPKPPDPNDFKLTSVMGGAAGVAIINGRPYGEGEYIKSKKIPVVHGQASPPKTARVRVRQIGDGVVLLESDGQTFTISLNRGVFVPNKTGVSDLEDE